MTEDELMENEQSFRNLNEVKYHVNELLIKNFRKRIS